jgi:hypothetical protein
MNKFLKLYPSLWVPKLGDKVLVINKLFSFYNYEIGFCGVITYIDKYEPIYLVRDESDDCINSHWVHSKDIEICE